MPDRPPCPRSRLLASAAVLAAASLSAAPAMAQTPAVAEQLQRIESQLADQSRRLSEQDVRLADQKREIDALRRERDQLLDALRGAGIPTSRPATLAAADQPGSAPAPAAAPAPSRQSAPAPPPAQLPSAPVGEKPDQPEPQPAAAVPASVGVLTPRGQFVFDPTIEYVNYSSTRLVFTGVEIVPGVNLGVVEASDVRRNTGAVTLAARYGVTDRLEVEARVPYVWRQDRFSAVRRAIPTDFEFPVKLDGDGIGDAEFNARYQINAGRGGWPIFVANLRAKAPLGDGPFDVPFNNQAVAQALPVGSGFWGVGGGITLLYPSDPALIYASLTYTANLPYTPNKRLGTSSVIIGRVQPGDTAGLNVGFGLSLNPRLSVSFGYAHDYIFEGHTRINDLSTSSPEVQVGRLLMGLSLRLTDRWTLNNSVEVGVTSDAPDLRFTIRAPYRF